MRSVVVVVACSLWGCAAASKSPPTAQRADAGVTVDASKEAFKPPAPSKSPAAWTDPDVISALTKSCAWTPPEPPADPDDVHRSPPPTSCARGHEQACVYDPCEEVAGRCEGQCEETCNGCGAACVSHCEACKKTCADDGCRRKCAERCGECRQKCVEGIDRCATSTCARAHLACSERLVAQWRASGCARVCRQAAECHARCLKDFKAGCDEACRARFVKACPEKLLGYCMFDPPVLGGPSVPFDFETQKD